MKKILHYLTFLAALPLSAQTFTATPNLAIPDDNTVMVFDLVVNGLPTTIDTLFGLETACLTMTHTYDSDMEVRLQAPDGTIVTLFSGVGGGDDDFTNTCIEGTGTPISSGAAPFTGTFQSMGVMGNVNNSQNPNGTWHLLCRDMAGQDIGFLMEWSITFGNTPAFPFMFTSSNLPIVKLTTQGQAIANEPKVPVYMQIIDNGAGLRNYTNATVFAYEGLIMTEWQGFSGPSYPKKNYDFELVDGAGLEMDTTILGMTTEHDWILKAEYLDHTLLKNTLTYEMARRMGLYAPNTRPCELIIDGEYMGYYTLTEKVKRDANRVDIAKLTTADTVGSALTGGYIIEMNINGDPADWTSVYPPINNATCGYNVEFKQVYPKITNILPVQLDYIHSYVDSFENVLSGANYTDPLVGYRKYIDVGSFIDFLIVNEFSANYDSYGRSTYLYKEKDTDGGKLKSGPPWDYDRAMADGTTTGWVWEITHPYWPFPFWWSRMWTDDTYRKELACRWFNLRENTLSTDSFMVAIDAMSGTIEEAAVRNFQLWNDLGNGTYADQIASLKIFITNRLDWIDATLAVENVTMPVFYLPTDTLFCAATLYDAGFNGNQYDYNWQPGPDTSVITFSQSGIYTLKVTDEYGCYSKKEMVVTIDQLDASFTDVATGAWDWSFSANNTTAVSYNWSFGDGGTSTLANPTHTYPSEGDYIVTLIVTDANGCTSSSQDTVQAYVVGYNALESNMGSVYPNPFNNQIQLQLNTISAEDITISLVNELGQIFAQQTQPKGGQTIVINTEQIPAGIYFLHVTIGDKTRVQKMVKRP